MGYPAVTGRGTLRTDATRARDLAPDGLPAPQFLRNFAAPEGRRFQLSLNRDGSLIFSARRAWERRRNGRRGEPPAQKHGAVFADRLAKKRTARASGVFTGALNFRRIKRESPLRHSEHRKSQLSASRGPNSRIKGVGSYPSLQRGRIKLR
jgi:hypothetical protein